jgi:hypothetical protein
MGAWTLTEYQSIINISKIMIKYRKKKKIGKSFHIILIKKELKYFYK